jgi:hypothetical protein
MYRECSYWWHTPCIRTVYAGILIRSYFKAVVNGNMTDELHAQHSVDINSDLSVWNFSCLHCRLRYQESLNILFKRGLRVWCAYCMLPQSTVIVFTFCWSQRFSLAQYCVTCPACYCTLSVRASHIAHCYLTKNSPSAVDSTVAYF